MRTFELEIIRFLRHISSPLLEVIMEVITFFGEQYIIIAIIAFLYFIVNKKLAEKLSYIIFSSLLINNAVKGIIKAPRPFQVDPSIEAARIETATGYSFPSGHTQNAATTYFSIAYYLKQKKYWIISGILVFLIGLSRLFLGVHFPSDVIIGMLLGLASTFLFHKLYALYGAHIKSRLILYLITIVIFLPLFIIFMVSKDAQKHRDFFTSFSLFLGFIFAVFIENKYVNFDCSISKKIKTLRFVLALMIAAIMQFGLKLIFPGHLLVFDMIRYFLVSFVTLGIYPLLLKKQLFF